MYIGVDWFWVVTLTLPATFAAAYIFTGRPTEKKGFKHVGVAMLLRVWCTGGIFILLEWSLLGGPALSGGFQNKLMVVMLSVCPPVTIFLLRLRRKPAWLTVAHSGGASLFWVFERESLVNFGYHVA